MKTCSKCGTSKPLESFNRDRRRKDGRYPRCSDCSKVDKVTSARRVRERDPDGDRARRARYRRTYRERHPDRVREQQRRADLRRNYGITPEEFSAKITAQSGVCAICGLPMTRPHVDHNHATGAVRGLLCSQCNLGIGHLQDSADVADAAARYLRAWEGQ